MLKKSIYTLIILGFMMALYPSLSYAVNQEIVSVEDNSCNGGECLPPGGGEPLECPTSGGPVCGPNQHCDCICEPNDEGDPGGYWTHNICHDNGLE